MNTNKEYISISSDEDLNYLLHRIEHGPLFAECFRFDTRELFWELLHRLDISRDDFESEYFYFDESRDLHISESEFDYVWISTYGLIAKGKATENKHVNACMNQYTVVSLLFEKAEEICATSNAYDVDGYNFGYLSELTPALFHNILFYIEVFAKAYLAFCGVRFPHKHGLSELFKIVNRTMYEKGHNDTLFQAHIITEFERVVEYIKSIPGDFKEHFVKYDDNSEDGIVIRFNRGALDGIKNIVDLSNDFINSTYYDSDDVMYLKSGLLERLLEKAENEEDRTRITDMYGYMVSPKA